MKKDFFDALEEVYTQGGIGNTLMRQEFNFSSSHDHSLNLRPSELNHGHSI